jgi:hypothetical protein
MNYRFGASKISPSDLDCIVATSADGSHFIVERAGQFLIIEAKRRYEELSVGQHILLGQLARQPNFTVWILFDDGPKREPVELWILKYKDGECRKIQFREITHEFVQENIDAWYAKANQMWQAGGNGEQVEKELQCAHGIKFSEPCGECDAIAYGYRVMRQPKQAELFEEEPKPKEITYIDPPCRCNAYDFPHYHPEGKRYSDVYTFGKG